MASNSTTLSTAGGYANGFTLSISWSENSTSVNNNSSNITATATLSKNKSVFWVTNAGVLRCYWHDDNGNYDRLIAESVIEEIGYQNNSRSVGGTFNATHKADGSLSGYAWAQWEARSSYGGYPPKSGSVATEWQALTKIARGVNISSVTGSFTDENLTPTINWVNNGNRVDIKLELPTLGVDPWKRWNNKQGASSFSPTFTQTEINDLLSRMPNTNTLTLRFTVVTVINGVDTFFSYLDKTFTVVNGNPQFANYAFADTNTTTTAITGNDQVMISGKSALAVTISAANKATAKKSATMAKYTFQVAGLNAEQAYTTSDITKALGSPTVAPTELPSGTRDLVVTAIDSRGNQTAITKQLTVVPYEAPKINASATRASGFENSTTVKISGSFSRIEVGGTAKNMVNTTSGVQYRYKATSTTTWGSWTNRTATIDAATGKVTVPDFTISLDNQQAFDFEFRITDKLQTTTASLSVPVGQPAFWIGADGRVSVGGMPQVQKPSGELGQLEVNGNAYANGKRLAELPITSDMLGSKSVSSDKIVDGAVASDKIDWTTIGGGVWTTFICNNPSTTARDVNVKTNLGTPLTLHIENGGTTFRVDSGAQNIMLVRQFWSARFQRINTDAPGVNGLVKNSTIYTYVYGKGDNNIISGCATEFRQTDNNVTYGALLLARGAKNSATNECIIQRTSPNSLLWHIHGKYLVEGSDSFASYSSQVTAGSTSNIPTVYQRSIGVSGISAIYNVLEVFEETDPVD